MFRDNGAVIIFALFSMFFCDRTSSECTQLTPCSCIFPNGQGYDLSNLTHSGVIRSTEQNYTFYLQPCKNAPLSNKTNSECYKGKGVSLCAQYNDKTYSLGTVEESKLLVELDISEQAMLVYHHGTITTKISLTCCPSCDEASLTVDSIKKDTTYNLRLKSPNACKLVMHTRGLSIGSILVILFFVFTGLYFICGAIILKLVRGATGWEMMPNHQFWCELPSLVRDGIVFTFNCFRADSYDRI